MNQAEMPATAEERGENPAIRHSVWALCGKFPAVYWREKGRDRACLTEFVEALARAGSLTTLIPEDHGGSGACLPRLH